MKKTPLKTILVLSMCVLALSACSGAKKKLGLTHSTPDEFAVLKRAPLELPPDYTLRPPRHGAPRPQELETDKQAAVAVFGATNPSTSMAGSSAEDILLQKAGATHVDDSIRTRVDAETSNTEDKDKPVAERLLGWAKRDKAEPESSVVDARAEAERLKHNKEAGLPATSGETPSVTK